MVQSSQQKEPSSTPAARVIFNVSVNLFEASLVDEGTKYQITVCGNTKDSWSSDFPITFD